MSKFLSSSPVWQTFGITIVRIILGFFLIYHGWEIFDQTKIDEYQTWDVFRQSFNGKLLVYTGKAAELIAGFLFVTGLFTRIASLLTIATMGYIAFVIGNAVIWNNDQHPFLFLLIAFLFFFIGPGNLSLDHTFFKRR